MALLLAVTRRIVHADAYVRSGGWAQATPSPMLTPAPSLTGRKVGVYGMGAIGRKIAARATAFECEVAYFSRTRYADLPYDFLPTLEDLADMVTEIGLATEGSLRLARLLEAGAPAAELASLMKRNNCRKALEIARTARDMLGAVGVASPVMRHLANLESVSSYEGTDDVQALILGRAITGLPAFA